MLHFKDYLTMFLFYLAHLIERLFHKTHSLGKVASSFSFTFNSLLNLVLISFTVHLTLTQNVNTVNSTEFYT